MRKTAAILFSLVSIAPLGCGSPSNPPADAADGGVLDASNDLGVESDTTDTSSADATCPSSLFYDSVHGVTWLANANLAASETFGLPTCGAGVSQPCVNAAGSMTYGSAVSWIAGMNAMNYLGHSNWQLPTTPSHDPGCGHTGPNGNSFGFGCTASALAWIYGNALRLSSPATAVGPMSNTVGPFHDIQPYLYWSATSAGANGYQTLSFNSGFQGANTAGNFLYVLPMVPGRIAGTTGDAGTALQPSADGSTVYDPVANVTWLSDANLAATNTFGLPRCTDASDTTACVAPDGAMTFMSVMQFVAAMNRAAYLGQTDWAIPPSDPTCTAGYSCNGSNNPMGELYYGQLQLHAGEPAGGPATASLGSFENLQPYLYWSCEANSIQDSCETDGGPAPHFEWSYSFGDGFLGTDLLENNLYVTAYFVGDGC